MVTALEFAQCSTYSILSFVVPKAFSRTKPAFTNKTVREKEEE
jgi:hypothetical protein